MVSRQSALDRSEIQDGLVTLLGAERVGLDPGELRELSADRYRKYATVHGIYEPPVPAAVVRPQSAGEVAAVLRFASEHLVNVVPRTGGTGTEGGLETIVEDTIVIDGSRLDRILEVDPIDMQVTAQCGVRLQGLEDLLRAQGFTTGHSPQSKPLAQLGGLVATRSIGQFSTLYGGIEDMVVGLEAVFPDGTITRIKNVPRRAAGPDIRHVVIGNEGALCFITEVTLKIFPYYPDNSRYFGFLLDDFSVAIDGLRQLVTAGYRPSVCRAYSPPDARQHFGDLAQGKNVVILVAEGPAPLAEATGTAIEGIFSPISAARLGAGVVADWLDNLNWGQDKIDAEKATMLREHHLGYTTEVSIGWKNAAELYDAVIGRIRREFPRSGDLTLLGAHSSHSYQTGTNLYFVYDYSIATEPRDEMREYHVPLNAIIVEEALRLGGSMVHHHGIGKYRAPWTEEEHGSAYYLLRGLKEQFDPSGIMNAGTIFPEEGFTDPYPDADKTGRCGGVI